MKRILFKFALLAAVLCGLASCKDNEYPVPGPGPQPEEIDPYTIIYYAHGGGNLDISLFANMLAMYNADKDSYDHVNIVGQYKFSSEGSFDKLLKQFEMFGVSEEELAAAKEYIDDMRSRSSRTSRFIINPADIIGLDPDSPPTALPFFDESCLLDDDNASVTSPDALAEFIDWAATMRPAKKYILVVSDHGGGYRPDDEIPDLETRGFVYDDGNQNDHFTAKSFAKALGKASVRPSVVYYDACLMNNAEYLFEIAPLCDYIVASTFVVPGQGGNYSELIDLLAENPDDIEKALAEYTQATVGRWDSSISKPDDPNEPVCYDLSVIRTSDVDELGGHIRAFVDKLISLYQSGDSEAKAKIDQITAGAYKVAESYPYYDLIKYLVEINIAFPEIFGSVFEQPIGQVYDNMIVYQQSSEWLLENQCNVDLSVLLGCNGHYTLDGWITMQYNADGTASGTFMDRTIEAAWPSTFEDTYCKLRFDELTGWSRWIMANGQEPSLECFSNYSPLLPADLSPTQGADVEE